MVELDLERASALRGWFADRPGPCAGLHALNTGHGTIWADRWPEPRAVLALAGSDYCLAGDAAALAAAELRSTVAGFVDAPAAFVPLLREAFAELVEWQRVVSCLRVAPRYSRPAATAVRRLDLADGGAVAALAPENAWIAKTWGGAEQLAASGYSWGAFAGGRLVSVACSFHVGDCCEEIGIVTESDFRGRGMSSACAGALCEDIIARGKTPSWSTSTDNLASLRVAEKLGFGFDRNDVLYAAGISVP